MDREPTTKRFGSGAWEGHGILRGATLLTLLILVASCVPPRQQPAVQQAPQVQDYGCSLFEEIGDIYVNDDEAEAIELLKEALDDPETRCRAAFYLFFLDRKGQQEWSEILNSPDCSEGADLERAIITEHAKFQSRITRCKRDRKWLKIQLKKCKAEKGQLRRENDQLNFEIKKLEEIRRETERLRLE